MDSEEKLLLSSASIQTELETNSDLPWANEFLRLNKCSISFRCSFFLVSSAYKTSDKAKNLAFGENLILSSIS